MLNKLNTIEKVFIIVLVALIVWLVGVFAIIRPIISNKEETEASLTTAQQNKQQTDERIATKPKIQQDIKDTKDLMNQKLAIFFDPTENYDVDQYIYQFAAKYLTINAFAVSDPAIVPVDAYKYSDIVFSYPLGDYAVEQRKSAEQTEEEAAKEAAKEGEAAEAEEVVSETALSQTVTITFECTYDNMKNFVEAIKDDGRALIVTSLAESKQESEKWSGSVTIEYLSVDRYEAK